MFQPLNTIKVLDFTHLLPGELLSTVLADLGAEVIRLERLSPGLVQSLPPLVKGESLYYWSVHRRKRRIGLNLKNKQGQEIVYKLVEGAALVLENFRPGVMQRLGFGYERLSQINPSLVYCSISGYGQTSAWKERPGHDLNFVAESGVLAANVDGSGKPVLPGVLVSDYMAAVYAAVSTLAALFARQTTGQGRHLDISMFECALSTQNILATMLLYDHGFYSQGAFSYNADLTNYHIYRCSDGRYLAVAALEKHFWERFCQIIGREDLALSYPPGSDQELKRQVENIIETRTQAEWMEMFAGADCCVSPVMTLSEALASLPARERQVVTSLPHPALGSVPQLKTPVHADGASRSEDNQLYDREKETGKLLAELGYSQAEIEALKAKAVIA